LNPAFGGVFFTPYLPEVLYGQPPVNPDSFVASEKSAYFVQPQYNGQRLGTGQYFALLVEMKRPERSMAINGEDGEQHGWSR